MQHFSTICAIEDPGGTVTHGEPIGPDLRISSAGQTQTLRSGARSRTSSEYAISIRLNVNACGLTFQSVILHNAAHEQDVAWLEAQLLSNHRIRGAIVVGPAMQVLSIIGQSRE